MSAIARFIHHLSDITGKIIAWLVVLLVCLTFYDVLMRYLFNRGSVALQELEWHLFSVILLLGASYTLKYGEHVRVDLIYASSKLSNRSRDYIDLFGNLCFLLPFCTLIIVSSIPFIETAYLAAEHSADPGGLSYRWLLKGMIPLGFLLLGLQGIADSLDIIQRIRNGST